MKFQTIFALFLLFSVCSHSKAQNESFLSRLLHPFNWFTAKSNSSAIEIKPNEEAPAAKTQILPPLDPPPIPIRMLTMSDNFDEIPKINSMDNIQIPLQMVPASVMPKQILPQPISPKSILSPPIIPPPRFPKRGFMKRIGEIVKSEVRMEEDESESTTDPLISSIMTKTTESTTENAETETELISDITTALKSSTDSIMDDETTTTPLPEPESKTETVLIFNISALPEAPTTVDSIETTKLITTEGDEVDLRPVYEKKEGKESIEELAAPNGQFLYQADFAKYLNQFYYSKPTVFDNLQMSKRHTPIFETMKI